MKMLVVVDYQNDFVKGSLAFEGADKLDHQIALRIEMAANDGEAIVCTYDTHKKNYLNTREGRNLPVEHCIEGTDGWELYGEVKTLIDELDETYAGVLHKIKKYSFGVGPAAMLELKDMLRMNNINPSDIDEIELCGLVSNICVVSNAVTFQAAFPEATIVVNRSLTDSFDKELNDKTMDVLKGLQVKVI